MRNLLLTLLLGTAFIHANAYPIDPRPLRRLISESEYIVSGHVLEVVELKAKKSEIWNTSVARIKVYKILKGSITGAVIEVAFPANLICPAPPRFESGTDIIAFLTRGNKYYETYALSYGLKTVTPEELPVYEARISEMQSIVKIKDPDELFMATVDWLVRCAESKVTRWEGVYELSPESDFMSYYATTQQPAYRFMLSAEQKLRLKNALLQSKTLSYDDMGLIDLVYPDNREAVYTILLNSLRAVDADNLWYADSFMKRILYSRSTSRMEEIYKTFEDLRFKKGKENELKDMLKEFTMLAGEEPK